MSILDDPSLWASPEDVRPPPQWNGTAWEFAALTVYDDEDDLPVAPGIVYAGNAPLPELLRFDFTYPVARGNAILLLAYSFDGEPQELEPLADAVSITINVPDGSTQFAWEVFAIETGSAPHTSGTTRTIGDGVEDPNVSYNCECEEENTERTLADMRRSLMRRLGYSAQVNTPPPGMAELLNEFLRDAQEQLYMRYSALRTQRMYRWLVEPGLRFYGIRANNDLCDLRLNPYRIEWAGVEDRNGSWIPLICGIPATFYTNANQWRGRPARYEVRQCIEIYPAPDDYYSLRVKGHFGLEPFAADADKCTIDSHAVFLFALGLGKLHYKQPDAPNYFAQATTYIGSLTGGSHMTRRYVPRTEELPPLPRPRMVRFDPE